MANGDPQPLPMTEGGGVDLRAPFFRQLETERGLPSGILSAMAEKESGGNALKGATDPKSSAAGLFQINRATAQDWGLSPQDRYDPVKSSIAAADTLAARTQRYGVERAVGMHYGGVGSPWDAPVGSSGLSPASYSADVFQRAQKYAGAEPPRIGYPSAAPQEGAVPGTAVGQILAAAPAPTPDSHETPYLMRLSDGSVQSRILHTDQPVTHGWLADYVQSQGGTYLGPPAPPEPAPPPPAIALPEPGAPGVPAEVVRMRAVSPTLAPAPPPARTAAVPAGDFWSRAYQFGPGDPMAAAFLMPPAPGPTPVPPPTPRATLREVYLPERSFTSRLPSIAGAVGFGTAGTALATPLGPEAQLAVGPLSAGVGSALGEGAQIVGERVLGAAPAESGTATQRMGNAFVRGVTFEGPAQALRYFPALAVSRAAPVAEAVETLRPILTGTAETAAPAGTRAAEAFKPGGYQFAQWWQETSQLGPKAIVDSWTKLGAEGQAKLAGEYAPAMRTVVNTLAEGGEKWSPWGFGTTVAGVPTAVLTGHPGATVAASIPAAREVVTQGVPSLMSSAIMNPSRLPWLVRLPRIAQTAGPYVGTAVRAGSQSLGATQWPEARQFPISGE